MLFVKKTEWEFGFYALPFGLKRFNLCSFSRDAQIMNTCGVYSSQILHVTSKEKKKKIKFSSFHSR